MPQIEIAGSRTPGTHEQREVAAEARRIRLLEGQGRVIEYMARGADTRAALERLGTVVDSVFPESAWAIFELESDGTQLCLAVSRRLSEAFTRTQGQILLRPRKDPTGAAAFRGEPVIVPDLESAALCPELLAVTRPQGLCAVWAHPVLNAVGKTLGVISLYFPDARMPGDEDCHIIDSLVTQASLIMEYGRRVELLRSADERFASLVASIPGVVYQRVVSPDGDIRYTYISDAARELFEVPPDEIVSDPNALFARHGPSYRQDFRERLLAASRDLTMWDVEAEIVTRSGQRKWTHALARPTRQADGSVVWNGVIMDATRIKLANMELAAASRAKSDFLANMSHELRTPLNAIIGFSEMILNEGFGPINNPRYLEYVSDIRDSGSHLLGIINDILDIAKVEAGKLTLNEDSVDVRAAIGTCVKLVRHRADEAGVSLGVRVGDRVGNLCADGRKFKQILVNLLSNAVKFTPGGGRAAVEVDIGDDGDLILCVSDNGPGISPENLTEVLSPFVQIDSGLNRKYDGTGLGLPLCRALVEAHGGRFELESTPGKGTAAIARFPPDRVLKQD